MRGTWPRPSSAISRSSHPSTFPSIDPSSTPSFTSSRPLPPTRSTRSSPSSTFRPAISSKPQPENPLSGLVDQSGPVLVRRLDDDVGSVQTGEFAAPGGAIVVGHHHEFLRLVDRLAAICQLSDAMLIGSHHLAVAVIARGPRHIDSIRHPVYEIEVEAGERWIQQRLLARLVRVDSVEGLRRCLQPFPHLGAGQ